ncbi:MAG: cadherin repeat domain-containing protein, partial [Planctomycetota bacterium]
EITVAGGLDHESAASHTVRVVATDDSGATAERDVVLTVSDVNEAPEDVEQLFFEPGWPGDEELAIFNARDEIAGLVELTDDVIDVTEPEPLTPQLGDERSIDTVELSVPVTMPLPPAPQLAQQAVVTAPSESTRSTSDGSPTRNFGATGPDPSRPAPTNAAESPQYQSNSLVDGDDARPGFLGKVALFVRGIATRLPGDRRDD